ncbi:MAG: potassium channel protein [Caldilineaceae bacterium]|nr:potassium channel protein [Caldilineaceae bacterium]
MKFLVSQLLYFLRDRPTRMNIIALGRFLLVLAGLVTLYSVIFHFLMAYEGRAEYSWVTGFYWTLTVMSTLGFGDITFHSDLGRIFSMTVLLSGIIFLLVLLPFTFLEFFYTPWMKAQEAVRAPNRLPAKTSGHVILTQHDAVTNALIERLNEYNYPYVLLIPDLTEALRLNDMGYKVVLGELDNPETYRRLHAENALLVATTASDQINTNVAFTVRETSDRVPIIATANSPASVDILELAGSSHVLQLAEMMGQWLARRVSAGDATAHVIGQFDELLIAEATVRRTALVGKTLAQTGLREKTGIAVLGTWERGKFQRSEPDTVITDNTVLVLAGSSEQIARYDASVCPKEFSSEPVVIIGGGRVGRAVSRSLAARGLDYRIVEVEEQRIRDPEKYIHGNAAELTVLEQAGIRKTPAVVVTTHDDDTNIYLTIYCRRLRPDVQIISRTRLDRNIVTLHRAGADFVLSYASLGANAIMNLLNRSNILMVAEGLDIVKIAIPDGLVGKSIAEANIRRKSGCTVVALHTHDTTEINPDPYRPLPKDAELVLIGTVEAENRFLRQFNR